MAKQKSGFAKMDPAKVREIASEGGRAAHEQGVAHEWDLHEARIAGSKGGLASHGRKRQLSETEDRARKSTGGVPYSGNLD